MTVLRREDVQSRVASWDACPHRMPRSPILAIVPLIIRRIRGPSLGHVKVSFIHAALETIPPCREGDPHARSMLIVPRRHVAVGMTKKSAAISWCA
jgi:hypothetical protein